MKLKKINIIISIIILIIIVTICILFGVKPIRNIIISLFQEEPKQNIKYEIYSNENNILKILVVATDEENGIKQIQLPNGDILKCNGKNRVAIDYVIETDGTYEFEVTTTNEKKFTQDIEVNDKFKEDVFSYEIIQQISTEKDYKIDYKSEMIESKYYYSIGADNTTWVQIDQDDIINIDEYDAFHKNRINSEDGSITLNLKKQDNFGNKVEKSYKLSEFHVTNELYHVEEQTLTGESLIQCIKDHDIKSGNYKLQINGQEYPAEIYNYEDEKVNYITDKNLGTTENDKKMVIMKYNGDLTIQEGNIITAQARKKGMFIYVNGKLTNNGEITMTARGANAEGQDVYLWKNEDNDEKPYEFVPKVGATGGNSKSAGTTNPQTIPGEKGNNGKDRGTGGGGSGNVKSVNIHNFNSGRFTVYSGKGEAGTSYSGGTGGGSGYR